MLGLSLEPLIEAIAAGNVVVLKPSELAPSCSAVLASVINMYLDDKAIKVFQGGVSVSQQLLQHKLNKIFFTGSAQVGRQVMAAAANHLIPVTLELGGKCPAVVDTISSSWDRELLYIQEAQKVTNSIKTYPGGYDVEEKAARACDCAALKYLGSEGIILL